MGLQRGVGVAERGRIAGGGDRKGRPAGWAGLVERVGLQARVFFSTLYFLTILSLMHCSPVADRHQWWSAYRSSRVRLPPGFAFVAGKGLDPSRGVSGKKILLKARKKGGPPTGRGGQSESFFERG